MSIYFDRTVYYVGYWVRCILVPIIFKCISQYYKMLSIDSMYVPHKIIIKGSLRLTSIVYVNFIVRWPLLARMISILLRTDTTRKNPRPLR